MAAASSPALRIHRNLRTGRWVLSAGRTRLSDHVALIASGVRFQVSQARRRAVVATHCREVHAWAICAAVRRAGTDYILARVPPTAHRGTYNPYRAPTFTDARTGRPLLAAATVWFTPAGMFYTGA
jgi:hypothetical protein